MIIDQLPLLGGDVQGTDEFPIERGTTTYKTTQAALIKAATDAAAAAQAAADEANEKGLPSGGTAGQVLTKAGSADYSASWEDPSGGDVTADMLGIVVTGARPAVAVTTGQYVIVRSSTITGIADGLYTAVNALSPSTDVTAADLAPVSDGGLNELKKSTLINAEVQNTSIRGVEGVASFTVTSGNGYGFFLLFTKECIALYSFEGSGVLPTIITIYGTMPSDMGLSISATTATITTATWRQHLVFANAGFIQINT